MFSHVTVGCKDINLAKTFYDAILIPLGMKRREVTPDGGPPSACWVGNLNELPRFYVYVPIDGKPSSVGNGSMVAFLSPTIDAVNEAYSAGMWAKGSDEGKPGMRDRYGDNYYGAYLRDPEGNKIHIVYRGDIVDQNA